MGKGFRLLTGIMFLNSWQLLAEQPDTTIGFRPLTGIKVLNINIEVFVKSKLWGFLSPFGD